MSLIIPEKQVYTVLDLKDVFFSLPLAEVSQPCLLLIGQTQRGVTAGNILGPGCPKDLKTLNADLLPFCQRFPGKRDYNGDIEGLLQELQTLG